MSNHTGGTYTFVKDRYDLRGCLAGCVGGMMSIGLLNMKLDMNIVNDQRFRIRKVSSGPSSILSSRRMATTSISTLANFTTVNAKRFSSSVSYTTPRCGIVYLRNTVAALSMPRTSSCRAWVLTR